MRMPTPTHVSRGVRYRCSMSFPDFPHAVFVHVFFFFFRQRITHSLLPPHLLLPRSLADSFTRQACPAHVAAHGKIGKFFDYPGNKLGDKNGDKIGDREDKWRFKMYMGTGSSSDPSSTASSFFPPGAACDVGLPVESDGVIAGLEECSCCTSADPLHRTGLMRHRTVGEVLEKSGKDYLEAKSGKGKLLSVVRVPLFIPPIDLLTLAPTE